MDPDTACACAQEERDTGGVADGRGNPARTVHDTRHKPDHRASLAILISHGVKRSKP
jgi:hypothetical protein